ncbi:MAG: flippase-like domain-containing protein [Clostridia bacterium]|nr:flippase-like domain-containing protein [Clostridia bacterium]
MKKHKWLAPVAMALLVLVTIYVVSRQSATFTAEGFLEYLAGIPAWGLIGATACMLGFIIFEGLGLLALCRAMGYPQRLHRGVMYSAADIYFSAITPSATGGQPASALLMMGDGIPAAVTTVVLLLNLALYNLSLLGVMAAGICIYPQVFSAFGAPAHVLIVLGVVLHVILLAGICLLIFHEKIFLRIMNLFLHLGQKLHMLKDAEARREKFLKIEADYKQSAGTLHRKVGFVLESLLYNLLQRVAVTLVPAVLYAASVGGVQGAGKLFAIQAMAAVGANSVPVPGAVGVADYLYLDGYGSLVADPVNLELLSRAFSFYICVLVCAVLLLVAIVSQKASRKCDQ